MSYYVYHICRPDMSLEEGYIGVTKDPKRRFNEHKRGNYTIGHAIHKYADIVMKILVETTEELALELETKLRPIEGIGWNLAKGGGFFPNTKGKPKTESHKKALSVAARGRQAWNRGIPRSQETKNKLSRAHKGRKLSEQTRFKMSKSKKGRAPVVANMRAVCPHCSKEMNIANAKRWHFDNCKNNLEVNNNESR